MLSTEPLAVGKRTLNHMGAEEDAGAEAWSVLLTETALLVGIGLVQFMALYELLRWVATVAGVRDFDMSLPRLFTLRQHF